MEVKRMVKYMRIRAMLTSNIAKMYIDDAEAMRISLNNLYKEIDITSAEDFVDRYEYMLDEEEELNGLYYSVMKQGQKLVITISIYRDGKQLDMRSKAVKEFKKEGFAYNKNYKKFIKIAL